MCTFKYTQPLVDTYGSAMVSRDMFEDFVHLLMKEDGLDEDTEETSQMTEDEEAGFSYGYYGIEEILHEKDGPNKHWELLYCGGSNGVLGHLKDFSHKYSIGLSVEKFDW